MENSNYEQVYRELLADPYNDTKSIGKCDVCQNFGIIHHIEKVVQSFDCPTCKSEGAK